MFWRRAFLLAIAFASCSLIGCGLTVPDIKESWDKDFPAEPTGCDAISSPVPSRCKVPKITATAQIEYEIRRKIYCELKDAVLEANHYPVTESSTLEDLNGGAVKQSGLIPLDWAAQIALSLQVDESSSLNPGAAVNQVLPNVTKIFGVQPSINATTLREQLGAFNSFAAAQAFSLGFGGSLSSTATRIDKFNPYYSVKYLMKKKTSDSVCIPKNDAFVRALQIPASSSPLIIESELGIKDWLVGAMFVNDLLLSGGVPSKPASGGGKKSGAQKQSGGTPKPDSISYEIKFVIVSNGNVTPTWKLIRFSANTGSAPFFGVGRTRTHDLIITIGPASGPEATQATLSHFSSQIGNAVSNSNRALLAQ